MATRRRLSLDQSADKKKAEQLALADKKKAMLKAMKKHLSVITYAAEEAGIQPRTHHNWMRDDTEYRKDILELQQRRIDFGTRKLLELVDEKDFRAVSMLNKCNGGFDGWNEEVNVSISGQVNHNHAVVVKELAKQVDMPALERAVQMLAAKKKEAVAVDAEIVEVIES